MNEIIKSFGHNAGKIWDVLETGSQVQTKIMKNTKLSENEFFGAIGWLARENKICKDKRTYTIGETNLTETIGTNAGRIWAALNKDNEIGVSAISRLTKIEKKDCYSALGWLACEGKITARITVRKK